MFPYLVSVVSALYNCSRTSNSFLVTLCNWERLILNFCWICFCNFNPHPAAFVSLLNELPWGDNLSCLPLKELKEGKLRLGIPVDICKDWIVFSLCLLISPPHLWSIKEPGNQALTRWLFWGASTIFSIYFPRNDGTRCHDLSFLNVEL